jgi:long-subunit acyl-CoA synthetase (AMP-forming)
MKKVAKEPPFKRFMFNFMCSLSLFVQRISPEKGIAFAKKLFKGVHSNLVGSDLRCIISGGGHVLPETLRVINAIGYYTLCGFGMTEVGISSLELRKDLDKRISGCVGVPVKTIEYKIQPFNNENPDLGELFIRGESVHSGTVSGGVLAPARLDPEGWYATGDIGRIHEGALYIEGRIKEVIINESGENVYPDELEDYFSSLPGVAQYSVLGVSNGTKYEDITLVLETSQKSEDEQMKILADKIYKVNTTLPVYKKIKTVLISHESLPLANGIKVKRQALKKNIEEGHGNYTKLDMKQLKALKE